jgi:NTP pyrophosphatase (non-canonical NTP hydrolase)
MYYIYHIEGKKVGCTSNPFKRIIQQQGYSDYKILAKTNCIAEASGLEREWQIKLGYKKDIITYKETINNFKTKKMIHVTEHTITFKKTFNNKLEGFKFPGFIELNDETIEVNNKVKNFLIANNHKSQHSLERYVYIQTLKNFISTLRPTIENLNNQEPEDNRFELIRDWAAIRGIYDEGNSHTQYVKLMEEAGELAQGLLKKDAHEIKDAIGDIVVVLTNLAALEGMQIEECIDSAYNEIANRKGKMENGTFVKEK